MTSKPTILIVEDEPAIRAGLLDVFLFHGYEVDTAETGTEGLEKALGGQHDMIILDVMLPGVDGYEICRQIRERDKNQCIIMLTAKGADDEVIQGLSLGADDYVVKPFSVAQLVLRVEAVLRRAGLNEPQDETLALTAGLAIDPVNLAGDKSGETLVFTRREMDVLLYLHQNRERPVPREELLHKVWGYREDLDIETRTVDIHMAKLRRKLEVDPKNPEVLVTVRGAGYRLVVAG
jgi:two-component system response regulator RegX3